MLNQLKWFKQAAHSHHVSLLFFMDFNTQEEIDLLHKKINIIIETLSSLLLAFELHDEKADQGLLQAIEKIDGDFGDKLNKISQ